MFRNFSTMLKSKIHRATITDANVDYEGSITIDSGLLRRAGIEEYEKVEIYNITNGERFSTYAIKGEEGSGEVCVNGAAAKKVNIGDKVIVCCYVLSMYFSASTCGDSGPIYKPLIVKVDEDNKVGV